MLFFIHQVDVLEIKYDKAYDIRELDDDTDDILSQNFYCVVRVEGIEGTWATQYFLPEPEDWVEQGLGMIGGISFQN